MPQPKVLGEYKRELAMQYLLFGGLRYSAETEILPDLIGKRVADFNSKTELDWIGDFSALKSLYFDIDRFANEDELRARLNELATTT